MLTSSQLLRSASPDVLLLVPPFAGIDRPSLGVHVLQACAASFGLRVSVLYVNLLLARLIGEINYEIIAHAPTSDLLGERFFARSAHGFSVPPPTDSFILRARSDRVRSAYRQLDRSVLLQSSDHCDALMHLVSRFLDVLDCRVIGCTTTFEQTNASLFLLRTLKARLPHITTLLGGANCEGPMATGLSEVADYVDFVFSGESEHTFPRVAAALLAGTYSGGRVIRGTPMLEMDRIPTPSFEEYYAQFRDILPDSPVWHSQQIWLPYESSRGCWWGQKHHCTFCGVNGGGMVFREKSPSHVLTELATLLASHPTQKICMVDNIMPHRFFRTLLPAMADEFSGLHIFYEQKANMSLEKLRLLKAAGVNIIQPGIESLSTDFLALMKKGVSARQNICLLRFAKMTRVYVNWNILYAFPNDRRSFYEETLDRIPLLSHLNPPSGVCHLSVDRFSPYHSSPDEFKVRNIRPIPAYEAVFPKSADHERLAYHFEADYESVCRLEPELVELLISAVDRWRDLWAQADVAAPVFHIAPLSHDKYLLLDTRPIEKVCDLGVLEQHEAITLLFGLDNACPETVEWALKNHLLMRCDSELVPLATTDETTFLRLEALASSQSQRINSTQKHAS